MSDLSQIFGTILDPNGSLRMNAKLQFIPLSTPFIVTEGIVTSTTQEINTDVNGEFEIYLLYGKYRVVVGGTDTFIINVPNDGDPHSLIDVLTSPLPVVSTYEGASPINPSDLANALGDSFGVRWSRQGDAEAARMRIAIIANYGLDGEGEQAVAGLIRAWNPLFIFTAGNNNYPLGLSGTIDANIGKYYYPYIYPYTGSYGTGSTVNRFFPAVGDIDWISDDLTPLYDYFSFMDKGYYKVALSDEIEFYVLDSCREEPDGFTPDSTQATWLRAQLTASTATWRIVVFHHSPYSSAPDYSDDWMNEWDFKLWGASMVITGNVPFYERVVKDEFTFLNCGVGGGQDLGTIGSPIAGSMKQYNSDFGAILLEINDYSIKVRFCNTMGVIVDTTEVLSVAKAKVYPNIAINPNGGLKMGPNGLEIDFNQIGFLQAAMARTNVGLPGISTEQRTTPASGNMLAESGFPIVGEGDQEIAPE
jgi:hypothetical protein